MIAYIMYCLKLRKEKCEWNEKDQKWVSLEDPSVEPCGQDNPDARIVDPSTGIKKESGALREREELRGSLYSWTEQKEVFQELRCHPQLVEMDRQTFEKHVHNRFADVQGYDASTGKFAGLERVKKVAYEQSDMIELDANECNLAGNSLTASYSDSH